MRIYYNEFDQKAVAWLRELMAEGLIPQGVVDGRSIVDVQPADLVGFTQCHFFAGIGGWAYALRLAGWPEDKPVWTASCPCQPFSQAGEGLGESDERHLWPVFRELIRALKPATVFGEQVASKAGRVWLAGVFADLEAMAYQRAGADLCAAGVGAPHIRQRLYWMANAGHRNRWSKQQPREPRENRRSELAGSCWMGEPIQQGLEGQPGNGNNRNQPRRDDSHPGRPTTETSAWSSYDIIDFRDGKRRRVEPGTFPLAHGIPERVGRLRGYGNAIVPQLAAEFIKACQEIGI